jgi:hypothetical protein
MTAIAAVVALTATPLLAQSVDPAPAYPAVPIIAAPPAPAQSGAPAATLNIPQISVNMDDAPAEAPKAAPQAAQRNRPAAEPQRATPIETVPIPPAAREIAPPTPAQPVPAMAAIEHAPSPVVATPDPIEAAPVPADSNDEVLPIAGGVLGALVLAGGAFAFGRRRKRGRAERVIVQRRSGPLILDTPAPIQTGAPAGAPLPTGFDMSRYGRHAQAAYRGPTPDNPSLSLRKRLKRARFYDQRERVGVLPVRTPAPADPAANPARANDYVISHRFSTGAPAFRPAYQS